MRCKIGCFNRPWNQLPFRRALQGISQAGFKYFGLLRHQQDFLVSADKSPDEIAALAREVEDAGLEVAVAFCPFTVGEDAAESAENLKRQIDAAKAFGADTLLMMGGKAEQEDRFCEIVSMCTDYASRQGVILALKNHGGLSMTAKEARRVAERIGADSFRIWYDPGNVMYYAGVEPVEDVKGVADYVSGVCVKDALGKGVPVNVSPGKGKIDFKRFFQVLLDSGFSGPCIVEILGGETPEEVDAEAKYTCEFLDSITG